MRPVFRWSIPGLLLIGLAVTGRTAEPEDEPGPGLELTTAPRLAVKFEALDDYTRLEDWENTTTLLLQLFAVPGDALVPLAGRDAEGRPVTRLVTVRAEARRRLAALPPAGRDAYRARANAAAAHALAEARKEKDAGQLADVSRRFPLTDAAADALRDLAVSAAAAGDDDLAGLYFRRLRQERVADLWSADDQLLAAGVFRRLGDKEQAESFEFRVRERKDPALLKKLEEGRAEDAKRKRTSDWPLYGGSLDRAARAHGGAPFLEAEWRFSTVRAEQTKEWLDRAEKLLAKRGEPVLNAFQPIALTVTPRWSRPPVPLVCVRSHWGIHALRTRELIFPARRWWLRSRPPLLLPGSPAWASSSRESLDMSVVDPLRANPTAIWVKNWLDNEPEGLFGNSVIGCLSSNGRYLFTVEGVEVAPRPAPRQIGVQPAEDKLQDQLAEESRSNRLHAFDLTTGKLKWVVPELRKGADQDLAGGFFLGPPLPVGDVLYAVVEVKWQLHLVRLDARTGKMLADWVLGTPARKLADDRPRRYRAVHLALAGGLLVCPTHCGALLAVDPIDGQLVWSHPYRAETPPPPPNAPPAPHTHGWPVDTPPMIQDGKVYYAPADGLDLLCLNRSDGSLVWKTERGDGDLYFGGVAEGKALIVGKKGVRAVDADTGKEAWTLAVGEPSGTGVAADGLYYLPLRKTTPAGESGIAAIDVKRGVIQSVSKTRGKEVPGNLMFFGPLLISQTATEVVAYPLLKVRLKDIQGRLNKNPNDVDPLTQRARLRLAGDDRKGAVDDLRRALKQDAEAAKRHGADALLFEVLADDLARDFAAAEGTLAEADKLTHAPAEDESRRRKARLLVLTARGRERQGKRLDALKTYLEAIRLGADGEPIQPPDEPDREVDLSVWAKARLRELLRAAPPEEGAKLEKWLSEQGPESFIGKDPAGAASVLIGPESAAGREARLTLAARLVRGEPADLVRADQLLQEVRRYPEDAERAARAVDRLGRLAAQRGLIADAAYYYRQLNRDFAAVRVRDGKTGADLFNELCADKRYLAFLERPDYPDAGFRWRANLEHGAFFPNPAYTLRFVGEPLPFFAERVLFIPKVETAARRPTDSTPGTRQRHLVLADRSFAALCTVLGGQRPGAFQAQTTGHLAIVPLGTRLHGLDPFGHGLLWTKELHPATPLPKTLRTVHGGVWLTYEDGWSQRLGAPLPLSPSALAVRTAAGLEVLDPVSGRTVWRRPDVAPAADLFGDDDALVLVEEDRVRVFRTADGSAVPASEPVDLYRERAGNLGRFVLLAEGGKDRPIVLRVRDPLTGKDVWRREHPAGSLVLTSHAAEWTGVVEPDGKLVVVGVRTGKAVVSGELGADPHRTVTAVHLLADAGQVYLAGYGPPAVAPRAATQSGFDPDLNLPAVPVNGTVAAYSVATGKLRWRRTVDEQFLLLDPTGDPPVLLFAAQRFRTGTGAALPSSALEVLDKNSGKALFSTDDLPPATAFHTLSVDRAQRRIELSSMRYRLTLEGE